MTYLIVFMVVDLAVLGLVLAYEHGRYCGLASNRVQHQID